MRVFKEMRALSLQKEIKQNWDKEPYLHVLNLQKRADLAWARLGAWRMLKFTDDSGVRVYPMCGNQILPESILNLGRCNLACWELMVNPGNLLNVSIFLDKIQKIPTLLLD